MAKHVNSVYEAVKLAQDWYESGYYNWFRGQMEPWPLRSSLNRAFERDGEELKGLAKLTKLCDLARQDASVSWLIEPNNVHAFFACAQHYGVPTHYIDFSRSPHIAAFFATNNPGQIVGKNACIYCCDKSFIEIVCSVVHKESDDRPKEGYPKIVTIEIQELWRMHAQQGEFLYCPATRFENLVELEAIIFPFSEPYSEVDISDIYPQLKSPLEEHLESLFADTSELELYHWLERRFPH